MVFLYLQAQSDLSKSINKQRSAADRYHADERNSLLRAEEKEKEAEDDKGELENSINSNSIKDGDSDDQTVNRHHRMMVTEKCCFYSIGKQEESC